MGLDTWFAFPPALATETVSESEFGHPVGFLRPRRPPTSPEFEGAIDLIAARRRGRRVVYIGFGSIHTPNAQRATREFICAAQELGALPVVQAERSALVPDGNGDEVVWLTSGDHRHLFPMVDVVVCHGGIGTCVAAIDAGKPLAIIPQWLDQFYWAAKFETLGVAAASCRIKGVEGSLRTLRRSLECDLDTPSAEYLRRSDGQPRVIADVVRLLARSTR